MKICVILLQDMGKIVVGDIDIQVERKHIKNMYMRVIPPDGKVKISAPLLFSDEQIKIFAVSKISWIKKRRAIMEEKAHRTERYYVTGETFLLLGKQYPLCVQHGSINKAFFCEQEIILQVRNNTPRARKAKIMEDWYRDIMKKIVPSMLGTWEKRIGVKTTDWKIQAMRTKWGTCNITERRIVLNLKLAERSPECLEYVIIHELLHLLEKSHNTKFKEYMDTYCPNWRNIRKSLAHN